MSFRNKRIWNIEWFGNDYVKKAGAQNHVLGLLTPETFPVLSYTNKHGRLWGAATLQQILAVLQHPAGLYEILVPDRNVKVYVDVDKTECSLDEIKKVIIHHFPNARMQISGREGSWHIILSNYYAPSVLDMRTVMIPFTTKYKTMGFDVGVYTKNRNFKCIGQSKPNQPVQAYIEGSLETSKHLIRHDFDDDSVNIMEMQWDFPKLSDLRKKDGSPALPFDLSVIPQGELPVPKDFDWLTSEPLQKLALIPCNKRGKEALDHNTIWRIMV